MSATHDIATATPRASREPTRRARRLHRLEPAAIAGVMSRDITNFRTFWKTTTFSSVLDPTIYLLAFGLGLGAFVERIVVAGREVPYVEFVGTGMVATAVLFSATFSAMYGVFVKHRFQHTYDAILAAPVDVEELATAEILWLGLRAGVYGCAPLLVTMLFGLDPVPGMLLVPLFGALTGLGFAGLGVFVAATASKIDHFNYVQSGLVTPLFLVSGTFFPIDQLPQALQIISLANPLHHCVELVRAAVFGLQATDLAHVAALALFALVTWRMAIARLERRLII